MNENWKNMSELGLSKYSCSDLGSIVRDSTRQKLKMNLHEHGYMHLVLSNDKNEIKNFYVHRLIYETFKGKIPDGYEIDHVDRVRHNNKLNNLRCVTKVENIKNRTLPKNIKGRKIVQLTPELIYVNEFCSMIEALQYIGTTTNTKAIKNICEHSRTMIRAKSNMDKYKKYKNYIWMFSEDYFDLTLNKNENEIWIELIIDGMIMLFSNYGRAQYPNGEITCGTPDSLDKNKDSYLTIIINKKTYRIHRLVMNAFNPINNSENLVVNHINGIKSDNRITNLEWATHSENSEACRAIGLIRYSVNDDMSHNLISTFSSYKKAYLETGYNHRKIEKLCKLGEKDDSGFYWKYCDTQKSKNKKNGRQVNVYDKDNNLLKTYTSIKEAALATNSTIDIVADMCKGKTKNLTNRLHIYKFNDIK